MSRREEMPQARVRGAIGVTRCAWRALEWMCRNSQQG